MRIGQMYCECCGKQMLFEPMIPAHWWCANAGCDQPLNSVLVFDCQVIPSVDALRGEQDAS